MAGKSALWRKVKIDIPEGYSPAERESIAQDVIDFMVDRTLKGKDKRNRAFKPGYSEGYAESRVGQVAGKRKGATPNLKLSGDMLEALGDYLKHQKGQITIGFDKGTEENAKADGNITGRYGKAKPVTAKRDFLGITKKDLGKILKDYPLVGREAAFKRVSSILINIETKKEAVQQAEEFAALHDLNLEELLEVINERFD